MQQRHKAKYNNDRADEDGPVTAENVIQRWEDVNIQYAKLKTRNPPPGSKQAEKLLQLEIMLNTLDMYGTDELAKRAALAEGKTMQEARGRGGRQ